MKMSDYFNLPIEQGDVMRINQFCTVKENNDGVAPFDAVVLAINNYDRLVDALKEIASGKGATIVQSWDKRRIASLLKELGHEI